MDNNELDKILKEELKDKIKPTKEVKDKIVQKVEEQKNIQKASSFKQATVEQKPEKNKFRMNFAKYISVAAMVVVIFTIGIFYNQNELLSDQGEDVLVTIQAIEPTKSENGTIANDSEFLITVEEENASVESVQKSLYVEPALEYTIEKTSNSNEYKLTFKQNIPDNTILKLQYVKDQITEDSWAYQTSNILSVTETFPYSESYSVSTKSVIEIEFSYASVENLEDYVEISPELEGTWEHIGKTWRFTPSTGLEEEQTYVVTIKSGIEAEDQVMENSYSFTFSTFEEPSNTYSKTLATVDGIYTCKSDEFPYIYFTGDIDGVDKVEIREFNDADSFIDYLESDDYDSSTSLGDYEFEDFKVENVYDGVDYDEYYLVLEKSLGTGYYVAVVKDDSGNELFNYPIQVNDLSAYAVETERDVLTWVADSDGNLAEGISVEYLGETQKTNSQGIAQFTDINDGSETIKYAKIGNDENKLIVGLYTYSLDNYPNAYIYTDRQLYKNTDTINIWGFIPMQLFYGDVTDEFYIELNNEGKQKVSVGEDGNLNYQIELNNHNDDDYATIYLYYKDTIISYRDIQIQNYELQNYSFEGVADKDYAYEGETFEFDVKVTSITGLIVPNKNVVIEYADTTYKEKTDENGLAHFAITIEAYDDEINPGIDYDTIYIYNGVSEEYTDSSDSFDIMILETNTDIEIERNDNTLSVELYKLLENDNIIIDEISELYNGSYDTEVEISLKESEYERYISGYEYNEYTKENEPIYAYISSSSETNIANVSTNDGKFEFDLSNLEYKEDTENVSYYYTLIFRYKDEKGNTVYEEYSDIYIDDAEDSNYEDNVFSWREYESWETSEMVTSYGYYDTYRYVFDSDIDMDYDFSIGDTISLSLCEETDGEDLQQIENNGKILRIVLQEDITSTQLIEDNNFDYTFVEDDFPFCIITSVYFLNGKFYRMPAYCFDFNKEDRKVDIEITADKEQYEPGDEVTLTIKTTNNGKAVESFVNISVVNEAVFALNLNGYTEGTTDTSLLDSIYTEKSFDIYTYSTYSDYILSEDGGGGGGDGEPRGDFADTACFETVYTDKNGTATLTFTLPDNVTTYRVTAQSANEDLYLGETSIDITSTLDFYIQVTEPRNVKSTDDLVLTATSIAEESYDVEFEFTITELDKTLTTTASTNSIASVNFGKLSVGTYHAVIKGTYDGQSDAIEYEFEIVNSSQEVKNKTTVNIQETTEITPTKNPIVLEIYNENMEQYIEYIDFIESTVTSRLDTRIAYNEVQSIKDKYYGTSSSMSSIDMDDYYGENNYLRNLKNQEEDLVLTALINYYTQGYCNGWGTSLDEDDNLFEYYLYLASNNESVLLDLLYLKEETDIDNYSKLLVTLSLEFVGDYQNAKELYGNIDLTADEKEEYASLIAIIDTFINKDDVVVEINNLIENNPSDEYLRFAILSFFENNSTEIAEEETVTISYGDTTETITLNGMEVKTYTISNEDLSTISFETDSDDLLISYYYQTSLEDVESDNIVKDVTIEIEGDIENGNTVNLIVNFDDCSDVNGEGEVRIALPNSLRLARDYNYYDDYYLMSNNIDYVTFYKKEDCTSMEIPLLVSLEGDYDFENIVYLCDGIYHISNTIDFEIK